MPLSHLRSTLATAVIPTCIAGLSGCGDTIAPQNVSGRVTIDSRPVEEGLVRLVPLDSGPVTVAFIEEGRFETLLFAGDHHLEFQIFESSSNEFVPQGIRPLKIVSSHERRFRVANGLNHSEFELSPRRTAAQRTRSHQSN